MRIVLDHDACTGHGRCYALAPDVFDADDQGHCVIKIDHIAEDQQASARVAVANCPEVALSIED
jgi:ferredoxin